MEDNSFWLTTGGNDCSIFLYYPDQSYPKWTKGYPTVFDEEYDVSFQLTGEVIGEEPVPDLDCDGDLSWAGVPIGSTVSGSFVVMNIGDPSSLLNWETTDWPIWGNWTFTPMSGMGLKPGDGPFNFDEIAGASYSWDEKGTYSIKVKAKGESGAESGWPDPLSVRMPMNQLRKVFFQNTIKSEFYSSLWVAPIGLETL